MESNWILTKTRLPKVGDKVAVSLRYKGSRQYWELDVTEHDIRGGKLYFGSSECDYWKQFELIED